LVLRSFENEVLYTRGNQKKTIEQSSSNNKLVSVKEKEPYTLRRWKGLEGLGERVWFNCVLL